MNFKQLIPLLGVILALSAIISFFSLPAAMSIIATCVLIALSWRNVFWGILFLAVYTPLEPFLLKFVPDEMYLYLRCGGEGFMVLLLLIIFFKSKIYARTPLDLPLLCFIVVGLVSMIINYEPGVPWYAGFLGLRQILRYVVLYYIVVWAKLTRPQIILLLKVMAGLVLLEVSLGLAQALIGERADMFFLPGKRREFPALDLVAGVEQFWLSGQRVFATLGRYDRLGVFLSFFLLIFSGLVFELKNIRARKILLGLIILSLPTFFLTYSRLSWLGFLFGLFFMGIIFKRSRALIAIFSISLLTLFLYLSFFVIMNQTRASRLTDRSYMAPAERILEAFSPKAWREGYKGFGRPYFLAEAPSKIIARHPVFGVGTGQFGGGVAASLGLRLRYDEAGLPFGIEGKAGQIDNNWFALWGEFGTLGLLAWILMLALCVKTSYTLWQRSPDPLSRGLGLGFLGALLGASLIAFLGPYFEVRQLSMYLWVFAGIVVSLRNISYENTPD